MSFFIQDNNPKKGSNQPKYPNIGQNEMGQQFTNQFSQQSGWNKQPQKKEWQQPQQQPYSNWNQQQQPNQTPNYNNQINQGVSNWATNPQTNKNPQSSYSGWDNALKGQQNTYQNTQGFQPNQGNMSNMQSFHMNSVFNKPPVKYKFPSPFIKYKIIPVLDEKKSLDVTTINDSDKKLKKNNLIVWDFHGGPNQLFYIKEQTNKKCYVINVSKGFTMEVPESNGKDGVQILVNPRNDTPNQFWQLISTGKEDEFMLKSFCGKVLDLSGHSVKNGTPVIQWKENGGKNQKWKIVPA